MIWRGKLIGLGVGLALAVLTRRPFLILVAVLIGHFFDMRMVSPRNVPPSNPPAPPARDPYAILGVAASASNEEIEQAYRRRMSEYHPDRVANAASEIRDLAGERAREINGAYEQVKRQRGL